MSAVDLTSTGTIQAIAIRTVENGPMREIPAAEVTVDGGIVGDLKSSPARGVTLISEEQWHDTMDELDVDLPWHTRRANVLVRGMNLAATMGQVLEIGEVRIRVEGETHPCGLMDKLQPGLKNALKPEVRAGVHGQVLQAGKFAVGDTIRVCPQQADVGV